MNMPEGNLKQLRSDAVLAMVRQELTEILTPLLGKASPAEIRQAVSEYGMRSIGVLIGVPEVRDGMIRIYLKNLFQAGAEWLELGYDGSSEEVVGII